MSALVWQDPPNPTKGRRARILTPEILAELRANPGQWALVSEDVANITATRWRKEFPDLEISTRSRGQRARSAVYARARVVT